MTQKARAMGDELARTDGEIDEVRAIPAFLPPSSQLIHEASGNIFADLDFDKVEASILQMRAKLMAHLACQWCHAEPSCGETGDRSV
jgi:hypothetical protein